MCRARYSHVCLASIVSQFELLVWRLWLKRILTITSKQVPAVIVPPTSGRSAFAAENRSWLALGSLRAHQHAEDPAMFTWHPHFSRRNVENMGLHHVHPQEAPTNGENEFVKCMAVDPVVSLWYVCEHDYLAVFSKCLNIIFQITSTCTDARLAPWELDLPVFLTCASI